MRSPELPARLSSDPHWYIRLGLVVSARALIISARLTCKDLEHRQPLCCNLIAAVIG